MKIALYSRPGTEMSDRDRGIISGAVRRNPSVFLLNRYLWELTGGDGGANVYPDEAYDLAERPDIAVSLGGDGTFLDSIKRFGIDSVPVLGVNLGRLGFLSNVPREQLEGALQAVVDHKFRIEERMLIEVCSDNDPDFARAYAFNEFALQRSGTAMVAVSTFVNGEMVATYWGDGVIVSTPSGSTAYSLSVGGPIVAPGCGCMVISPIAPHNLTMRPVVVPDSSEITFRVTARDGRLSAAIDGNYTDICDGDVYRVRKSEKKVFLVVLQNISFYDTLRNKMAWGFDRRDDKM